MSFFNFKKKLEVQEIPDYSNLPLEEQLNKFKEELYLSKENERKFAKG